MTIIGFETQTHETKTITAGIPRVIRETHGWLADYLGIAGVQVGWVNTVDLPRSYAFKASPYLSSDPILNAAQVKLSEIDVLVVTDIATLFDVRLVNAEKQRRNLPVVVLIHDILPITHPEWFPSGSSKHFRLFLQRMLHIADHLLFTTNFVKEEFLGLGWTTNAQIHTIGLGSIHAQRQPTPAPQSEISLLCVSTVEPRKGHRRLLRAFDELRQSGKDVTLHLVGKRGWAEEDLYDEIQGHPDFGARIQWHQNANDEEVLALASRCTVGVIPSEEEGFGMFVEEALTLGLKVVASDIPVFRERPQPNVYYAPLSGEGLAKTILEASTTPWQSLESSPVRTMRDFAEDLSILLLDVAKPHR